MTFESFKRRVSALAGKVGIRADFKSDEHGRHIATLSDGTVIIGNSTCLRVEVRWGSGHRAYATI